MSADTVNVPRMTARMWVEARRVIQQEPSSKWAVRNCIRAEADLSSAIDVALAASTPVGGWEDISTHDGSREPVLLWFPDFAPQGVVIGFYKAPEPDCYYPGQWVDDLTNEPFEVDKGEVFPSLWMPLPPPPSVSTDKGDHIGETNDMIGGGCSSNEGAG